MGLVPPLHPVDTFAFKTKKVNILYFESLQLICKAFFIHLALVISKDSFAETTHVSTG
jgi:hypothetical protein